MTRIPTSAHTKSTRRATVALAAGSLAVLTAAAAGIPAAAALPARTASATTLAAAVARPSISVSPSDPIAWERYDVTGGFGARVVRPVRLERRAPGGTWTLVTSSSSFSSGTYRMTTYARPGTAELRVVAPATTTPAGSLPELVSDTVTVTASAQTATLSAPDTSPVGTSMSVSATFGPIRPGRPVALERRVGSSWQLVTTATQDATGTATFAHTPDTDGDLVLRAVAAAYRGASSTSTAAATVRVTQTPVPDAAYRRITDGQASAAGISADGKTVVYALDGALQLQRGTSAPVPLTTASGEPITGVEDVTVSADGAYAAYLVPVPDPQAPPFPDKRLIRIDLTSRAQVSVPRPRDRKVQGLRIRALSADGGRVLFTSDQDEVVEINAYDFGTKTASRAPLVEREHLFADLTADPDVAVIMRPTGQLHRWTVGSDVTTAVGTTLPLWSPEGQIAVDGSGRYVVSWHAPPGLDNPTQTGVFVFDTTTGKFTRLQDTEWMYIASVAISRDGRWIAFGATSGNSVAVRDRVTGDGGPVSHSAHGSDNDPSTLLAFAPGGDRVVFASDGGDYTGDDPVDTPDGLRWRTYVWTAPTPD